MTAPGENLFGNQPLPVSGSLTVPTVKSGKIVGTHPLGGVTLEILRADYSPLPRARSSTRHRLSSTTGRGRQLEPSRSPTGAGLRLLHGRRDRAAGAAAQAPIVTLHTSAAITLQASSVTVASGGRVTFSGPSRPYQAGRSVNILEPLGGG